MDSAKSEPSDLLKTPEKIRQIDGHRQPPPWAVKTPKQLSGPPTSTAHRRPRSCGATKLPEKLEVLRRIFNAMDSSLRLLRMRKSMPVFSRIRTMVECMAERRFAYGHLAQLKFIMPEEIIIKRVSLVDDETRCVKRDLHIMLNPCMVKNGKRKRGDGADGSSLRELLRLRLSHFYETQPKGTEMPRATLPEPFNQSEEEPQLNTARASHSSCDADFSYTDSLPELQPKAASHISQSSRNHFSGKIHRNDVAVSSRPAHCPIYLSSEPTLTIGGLTPEAHLYMTSPCTGPSRCTRESADGGLHFPDEKETPIKLVLTPSKCMENTTQVLPPSKRSSFSPDEEPGCSSNKRVGQSSCARVLKFDSHVEKPNIVLELSDSESNDTLDTLPENLLQLLKQRDATTNEQATRRMAIANVPKIFDRILYLFQSSKFSFIEREELIIKLTECHSDIVDESEIKEQLRLLKEIIPEWISEKWSPSRSVLYSINKTLSPDRLRARIKKAV